jgi:hypothetical protein
VSSVCAVLWAGTISGTSFLANIARFRCRWYVSTMASAVDIIEEQIRALSTPDKEALLRVLLEELDGPPDPQVEAAWLAEVQRAKFPLIGPMRFPGMGTG